MGKVTSKTVFYRSTGSLVARFKTSSPKSVDDTCLEAPQALGKCSCKAYSAKDASDIFRKLGSKKMPSEDGILLKFSMNCPDLEASWKQIRCNAFLLPLFAEIK